MKTIGEYTIILIMLLFLIPNKGMTSPQSPDLLIYNGDTTVVYTLLLEKYFENIKSDKENEKLFGLTFREGASFNCWRGYQAIYIIENDSLFLEHITSCNELRNTGSIDVKESKKRIIQIFGNWAKNEKVFIDWYTGNMSLPDGVILRWDGVFYTSFEKEIRIEIDQGEIKKIFEIENYIDEPDKINRRYRDTVSNVLFEEIKKKDWRKIDKFDCSEPYLITIGKGGTITDVKMWDYQTKEEIRLLWTRREYNYCIRTIKRSLKDLKFDILRRNGQPIEEKIYLAIWFNEDGTIENWTN